jgi:hypothetical protein
MNILLIYGFSKCLPRFRNHILYIYESLVSILHINTIRRTCASRNNKKGLFGYREITSNYKHQTTIYAIVLVNTLQQFTVCYA